MTRVFFGWGVLMGVIGLVGILFYGFSDPENAWLFIGVFVTMVTLAVVLVVTGYGRTLAGGVRALPDASPPVPLLALATVLAATGAELGLWLVLIGAGVALIAVAGLIREARAQRRDVAAARAADGPAEGGRGS